MPITLTLDDRAFLAYSCDVEPSVSIFEQHGLSSLRIQNSQKKWHRDSRRQASIWLIALLFCQAASSQGNRVTYNGRQLFLSGANLAWMSFANDIGPGAKDYTAFGDILLQFHDHGGNAVRWWLHADGRSTPAFDDSGIVVGPGVNTLQNLKKALDIAWERQIGVKLCLWSFDMLRSSNTEALLKRNRALLLDTTSTDAYLTNCLIPMVRALKGHPAIIAWEIFNEPEGMSDEFFFSGVQHVPLAAIQRFINLCAGAIHRTDSSTLVTTGAWCFKSLTDIPDGTLTKSSGGVLPVGPTEYQELTGRFNQKYKLSLNADEILRYVQRISSLANYNFYSNSRLVAAGGDPDGTLDFYSVHYYDWAGTSLSPFHHPAAAWGLDKPIVVSEFAMKDTYGVLKVNLFGKLIQTGYAGALPWSWTDASFSSPDDMLAGMQFLWDNYRQDVDVRGVGGSPMPVPIEFVLRQNYPNPFNPATTISLSLPTRSQVSIRLFNVLGQEIAELMNETMEKGNHSILWSTAGPSGVYFCTMEAKTVEGTPQSFRRTIKLTLLR